jgi:nitrate reductase alpha subunit
MGYSRHLPRHPHDADLFRGGGTLWLNDEDAESVEIKDNDWVEIFNLNGVMMARAVVNHRIPCGKPSCTTPMNGR